MTAVPIPDWDRRGIIPPINSKDLTSPERSHLAAERKAVVRMLMRIPAANVLDRSGFESRLEEIDFELAQKTGLSLKPAKATLTFNGAPVVGSHGVFAEFGTKAAGLFTEAIATITSAFTAELATKGPLPNREAGQLLIAGTAIGSFGFELEERDLEAPRLPDFQSPTSQALDIAIHLMESTFGTDEELADAVSSTDNRAVSAVRTFLEELAQNNAVCTLAIGERYIRFPDVESVQNSVDRLSVENVTEVTESFFGVFQGVLPTALTFEFKVGLEQEIIRGKIAVSVKDPGAINAHLGEPTQISVVAMRVGTGNPRYTLIMAPVFE